MAHTPDVHESSASDAPPLPAVEWGKIGQVPPARIPIDARRPEDPLPVADVVILTWTSAEWSALDQVFLGTGPRSASEYEWKHAWHPYTRGASGFTADPKSGELWGSFQLVSITDRSGRPWRVLLFKSSSHLAHPPWIQGLSAMIRCILADTRADRIYSIGTAGGARTSERLGDAIITNAALLDLQRPQNTVDPDNGAMFRCKTWFPSTAILGDVERHLLFHMNQVVTPGALESLYGLLRQKHAGDASMNGIALGDLVNDPIRPEELGSPRVRPMKDAALLTTDFYFIAEGRDAAAYSFLEMDDAVIAREAERLGARYAFVRNVSDPVVRERTGSGKKIPDGIRADWSGLIYTHFGLYTSYNGALATWATIAGDGRGVYNPARQTKAPSAEDPLEVKLVYDVRSCGSCSFFWPEDTKKQPYGPYTAFDFDVDVPYAALAASRTAPSRWVLGRTRPPSFPNPEVVDGCRKAPIMTIGINPNLTAFAPGQTGAAWAYPNFSSDNGTDAWTKYAWYYRYRSVYQEKLDLEFTRKFILPEGRVIAPRPGKVVSATRADDSPAWSVVVLYDGDSAYTTLALPGKAGDFPYVLLFDTYEPRNAFVAGDTIAGRISVPAGIRVDVDQAPQTYYMQFVPVLEQFQSTLHKAGHTDAPLRVGEDVQQLDMVACASPHWNPGFLGGTDESENAIIDMCVRKNAWAIKQFVQSRPAILFLVGKASWDMFRASFGAFVKRSTPISTHPVDRDFTLLRETTDPKAPCEIVLDVTVDGRRYQSTTRLVITPHFSYSTNFAVQWRLSQPDWAQITAENPGLLPLVTGSKDFKLTKPDPKYPNDYVVLQLSNDAKEAAAAEALLVEKVPAAHTALAPFRYDAHAMMAGVLDELYSRGTLSWTDGVEGKHGYLSRTEGSCRFCVNERWQFPGGCAYGKDKEAPPPAGFLEKVAAHVAATGAPQDPKKA